MGWAGGAPSVVAGPTAWLVAQGWSCLLGRMVSKPAIIQVGGWRGGRRGRTPGTKPRFPGHALGPLKTEDHPKTNKELDNLSYGESLVQFSLEKRRLGGVSSMCIDTWREDATKTEAGSCQWCPTTGQEAMGTDWSPASL